MGIEIRQQLRLTQSLVMTPQLQLAIKLLQLSRLELQEHVQQELVENPFLDENTDGKEESSERADGGEKGEAAAPAPEPGLLAAAQEGDWAERVQEILPESRGTEVSQSAMKDVDLDRYLENQSRGEPPPFIRHDASEELPQDHDTRYVQRGTLFDHVAWQVRLSEFTAAEETLALSVLGNLDRDGYFRGYYDEKGAYHAVPSLDDLADEAGLELDEAEEVLRELQHMDPVGVAARDLRECLLAQADVLKLEPTLVEIIDKHLGDIEKRNYPAIAKAVGLDVEDVYAATELIGTLEPRPGRAFVSEEPESIVPDVEVRRAADGSWQVSVNDDGLPRLRIARYYRDVIRRDPTAREYVRGKVRSAQWLIRSINQRQQTLLRVTERIVERQRDFFERGSAELRPMILKDIADDLGMHESTIGRVTTSKYVQTPHGVFELKYFFNSRIRRLDEEDIASESVRIEIKQIIAGEDGKEPFSDQQIVKLLADKGIVIARRTVAKYRESMNILSSSRRKKYF
ncbi:MAG: RNA polymerase factor sigma-54 [Deltaproteobacteria bacterium]|nr:RNA polymerase factor sigma-54 [Deltaproteobacteria bacterium]